MFSKAQQKQVGPTQVQMEADIQKRSCHSRNIGNLLVTWGTLLAEGPSKGLVGFQDHRQLDVSSTKDVSLSQLSKSRFLFADTFTCEAIVTVSELECFLYRVEMLGLTLQDKHGTQTRDKPMIVWQEVRGFEVTASVFSTNKHMKLFKIKPTGEHRF